MNDVAIVYDKFLADGGGERVFDIIAEAFPDAPIYALSAFPKEKWEGRYKRKIHTAPLSWLFKSRAAVVFLYPLACTLMARLEVSAKCVIVYSSSCGKYARLFSKNTILYSNYPNRGVFELEKVLRSPLLNLIGRPIANLMKRREISELQKFDKIFSISSTSQLALKKYTGFDSNVLRCPYNPKFIDGRQGKTTATTNELKYFLMVSRLEAEKELEYAFEAFRETQYRLRVAGSGSLLRKYKKTFGSERVEFLGFVSDETLANEIRNCQAVVFPSEIEYSLVPIEANALGKPVIALDTNAAREILIDWQEDRVNGCAIFYRSKSAQSIVTAISTAQSVSWDSAKIAKNADRFKPNLFKEQLWELACQR